MSGEHRAWYGRSARGCFVLGSDARAEEFDAAERMRDALQERGLPVWFGWRDKGTCRDPTDYYEICEAAIRDCVGYILYLPSVPPDPRRGFGLDNLVEELEIARAAGKPVLAVRSGPDSPIGHFEPLPAGADQTDITGLPLDEAAARLEEAVRALVRS
jgi:hypothetical protein